MKSNKCLVVLLVLSLICSCSAFTVSAKTKKIKLSQAKVTLNVGKSKTLRVKNAGDKIKWSVSGKKVISIKPSKNKCKVTAKAAGKAVIKAKYKKKIYKCTVTVKGTSMANSTTETASNWNINRTVIDNNTSTEAGTNANTTTEAQHTHAWSDWQVTQAATCTTTGKQTRSCSCGETVTENIPATGHVNVELQHQKKAECGDGYTGDYVCKDCGVIVSTGTVISGTGNHIWDEGTMNEGYNCEEGGIKTYECKVCHETKTDAVEAHAHSYTTYVTVKEATCTSPGLRRTECHECGDVKEVEIEKTSHSYTKTGTTTIDGKKYNVYTCSVCGETYKEECQTTSNVWYLTTTDKGYSYTYTSSNSFISTNEVNLYYQKRGSRLAVAFTITTSLENVMSGVEKYTKNKTCSTIVLVPIMSSEETTDGLDATEVSEYITSWIGETGRSKYLYDSTVYRSYDSDTSEIPYLEVIKN